MPARRQASASIIVALSSPRDKSSHVKLDDGPEKYMGLHYSESTMKYLLYLTSVPAHCLDSSGELGVKELL